MMSNTQGLIYSGAYAQGTEWMDWDSSLHTSELARKVINKIESGLARIFGPGVIRAAVSDLADIDMPIACGATRAFEGGDTLAEAITKIYGVVCSEETIVVLIYPRQVEYMMMSSASDIAEDEQYWDSVFYYAIESISALVPEWMSISIKPAAMMTVAQTLPVGDALKNKICSDALELFCTYYTGLDVSLDAMEEHCFSLLDSIQPMTGTIMKSIADQKLRYPQVPESERNIMGLTRIAHALHTAGGMSMMPVGEMARA